MKKHALTEHYLVPAVLFLLNICLVHLICVLVAGSVYSTECRIALTFTFALLTGSLLLRKQVLLSGSILFYVLVVLWF